MHPAANPPTPADARIASANRAGHPANCPGRTDKRMLIARHRGRRSKMRTEPEHAPLSAQVKLAVMETWGIKVTRSPAQFGKLLRSVLQ